MGCATMTRRDYELIARALKRSAPTLSAHPERSQWVVSINYVADALYQDNPRNFDRALFLVNCGVNQP